MYRKLYDFDFDEWLANGHQWVRDAPLWVQKQLANNSDLAADPNGRAEFVDEKYYRIYARGFVYGSVYGWSWVR